MADHGDNISAGTQVVSLVEVRGTNNSLVHPRGAVGVVTRTPTGEEDRFLVRFPDGFEFSLLPEQLEILKHFKARPGSGTDAIALPGTAISPTPIGDFDSENLVIYRCVVGSRAYGLPVRVEAHRDRQLAVKRGPLPWAEVDAWRKELHRDFERGLAETKVPERPAYEAANSFPIKARRQMVKCILSLNSQPRNVNSRGG